MARLLIGCFHFFCPGCSQVQELEMAALNLCHRQKAAVTLCARALLRPSFRFPLLPSFNVMLNGTTEFY
jgi:hypothetical protein